MAKAELGQRLKARVDQLVTNIFHKEHFTFGPGTGETNPRSELHARGGKIVGVQHADGGHSLMQERDIYHIYDVKGNLTERFRMGKPGRGHTSMTDEEVQRHLADWPPKKGGTSS